MLGSCPLNSTVVNHTGAIVGKAFAEGRVVGVMSDVKSKVRGRDYILDSLSPSPASQLNALVLALQCMRSMANVRASQNLYELLGMSNHDTTTRAGLTAYNRKRQ